MLLFFLAAVRWSSWLLFAMGVLVLLSVFVTRGERRIERLLPPKPLWGTVAAFIAITFLGAAVSALNLGLPGRGYGLSLPGGTLEVLVIWTGIAGAIFLLWLALWRSHPARSPPWKRGALVLCLATFFASPTLFLLLQRDLGPPKAKQVLQFVLVLMAVSVALALALPEFGASARRGARKPQAR